MGRSAGRFVLFHPDYTVGPGIAPDLLTPPEGRRSRALALAITAGGELHPALRTSLQHRPLPYGCMSLLQGGFRSTFQERP